jgi:hypothetical protein
LPRPRFPLLEDDERVPLLLVLLPLLLRVLLPDDLVLLLLGW